MHDPMTLAFTIPNPLTLRKKYPSSLVEVWHVDPERHGNDDSCDWFGSHALTEADKAWLRKEGEGEHDFFFRGILKLVEADDGRLTDNPLGERWPGGMSAASSFEVLCGIASIILWRMPGYGVHARKRRFSGWRMHRAMAAAMPTLVGLVCHSTDNLHAMIDDARNDYGVAVEPDVTIRMQRERAALAGEWRALPGPFAQVTAVAMHWSHDSAPQLPTPERAARTTVRHEAPRVGRNDPCPCGSGKKYKHCHGKLI